MNIDLIFLFLMYAFSSISLILSVYALWTVLELRDEIKRSKVEKRLKSAVASTRPKTNAWPPR